MNIAGFPGTGKSYFCSKNNLHTHDSDSSAYSKLKDGTPNPNFIEDYFNHLDNLQYVPGLMVFVSTHEKVLAELDKRGMNYVIIIPKQTLLAEYVKRYEERGSPKEFIDLIINNWHAWLTDIKSKYRYFELDSGQTITDFMIETYEIGHDGSKAIEF